VERVVTRAYLDHAATTPMRPEAVEAMLPYLSGHFGNPSGGHAESRRARRALDDAREEIATLLGADFSEVVFTSGGTEADNLAIVGGWEARTDPPRQARAIVYTGMEHHAVLNTCRALADRTGAELRVVKAGKDGIVDLEALSVACDSAVALVSVMAVNNEIGTVQPLQEVAGVVRSNSPGAVLHTDAVQAVPWLDVAELTRCADMVAISAHKFGGPKGVGALVVRNGTSVFPLIHGGGQERERRSGTSNVAGVVAMAAALTATVEEQDRVVPVVSRMRDRLGDGLLASVTGSVETGRREQRTAGHLHMRFSGSDAEALVVLLDQAGVAVSAGAACSSGAVEPSHVLLSMGFGHDEAASGIRFSLGAGTTDTEIDLALRTVPAAVAQLRD
jgi:cysteine desulfurase